MHCCSHTSHRSNSRKYNGTALFPFLRTKIKAKLDKSLRCHNCILQYCQLSYRSAETLFHELFTHYTVATIQPKTYLTFNELERKNINTKVSANKSKSMKTVNIFVVLPYWFGEWGNTDLLKAIFTILWLSIIKILKAYVQGVKCNFHLFTNSNLFKNSTLNYAYFKVISPHWSSKFGEIISALDN